MCWVGWVEGKPRQKHPVNNTFPGTSLEQVSLSLSLMATLHPAALSQFLLQEYTMDRLGSPPSAPQPCTQGLGLTFEGDRYAVNPRRQGAPGGLAAQSRFTWLTL